MHPAPMLSTALIGVALIVGGTALATNFRGFSTWYVKQAIMSVSGTDRLLRRIQPWKSLSQRPLEDQVRRQVWLLRVIGASFAAAGVFMFLAGAFGIGHVLTN